MLKNAARASELAAGELAGHMAMGSELRVLALQSPQLVINEIAAEFERRTLHRIVQVAPSNEMPVHIQGRIAKGDDFDALFLMAPRYFMWVA